MARYLPVNVGQVARRYLRNPALRRFVDMECYCWSVVPADRTPMINAGMVFCDRHYGGVNYPKGGVGQIAQKLAQGLEACGGQIRYGAPVRRILEERGRAVGVELSRGKSSLPARSSPMPPAGIPLSASGRDPCRRRSGTGRAAISNPPVS